MVKGSPSQHQRAGAMADAVLNVITEFREGLVVTIRNEQWVIAETTSAARFKNNRSFADAVGNVEHGAIGFGDRDCSNEARTPISTIYFSEF